MKYIKTLLVKCRFRERFGFIQAHIKFCVPRNVFPFAKAFFFLSGQLGVRFIKERVNPKFVLWEGVKTPLYNPTTLRFPWL